MRRPAGSLCAYIIYRNSVQSVAGGGSDSGDDDAVPHTTSRGPGGGKRL